MKMLKLLQLIKDNAGVTQALTIRQEADTATVLLYGVIGGYWGDIDAVSFAKQLAGIDAKTIHLRINSPGGDVFEARAMMTALRQHSAHVIGHIDGLAASAATGVAMACDELEITRGANFMIHNAWTLALGNRHDMAATAKMLDQVDGELADDYALRSKQEKGQIVTWMDDETWMTAAEAVERGFADRMVESVKTAENSAGWNLGAYDNVPKALLNQAPANDTDFAQHRATLERHMAFLQRIA